MPPWTRCSRLPDVLVSLAEAPPGRADLARHRAITLQAGSHTGGPGTRSGPLLAIAAGQAARNGLCRPPAPAPWVARAREARDGPQGLSTGDVEELKRLRAENAELRMERDVLKRSVVLWVKEATK